MTRVVSIAQSGANNVTMRNRIINGNMMIDQRNAGASVSNVSGSTTYAIDRWAYYASGASKFTVQQSSTAPAGFGKSMLITSSASTTIGASDEYWLIQPVEGFNTVDLAWGTASAQPITVSFWVRSSLTGNFGGSIINGAYNYSFPFLYTISSADTWEYKTVLITAPTSGTWVGGTNGTGLRMVFSLAVGTSYGNGTVNTWQSGTYKVAPTGATNMLTTNGATLYITGVQLEAGTTATPFEQRLYGTELALCQRYYYKIKATGSADFFGSGLAYGTTLGRTTTPFKVSLRTSPTALEQSGTASDYRLNSSVASGVICSAVPVFVSASTEMACVDFTVASGLTAGNATLSLANTGINAYLAWSAEL